MEDADAQPHEVPLPQDGEEPDHEPDVSESNTQTSGTAPRQGDAGVRDTSEASKTAGPSTSGENSNAQARSRPDPHAREREELRRQKAQKDEERAKQREARNKRKAERQAKLEAHRAQAEQRRLEAEAIRKQSESFQKLATDRARFERTRAAANTSSSDSSDQSIEEVLELEDLPGEEDFLKYFKTNREYSPDRVEILNQCINGDSIAKIDQELREAEQALATGEIPRGEDLEELLEAYENLSQRINHLCHNQGKFATLRGLNRGKTLLELDQDLKQRAEGLLQCYGQRLRSYKEARQARRQNKRGRPRMGSLPSEHLEQLAGATRPGILKHTTRSSSASADLDRSQRYFAGRPVSASGPSAPRSIRFTTESPGNGNHMVTSSNFANGSREPGFSSSGLNGQSHGGARPRGQAATSSGADTTSPGFEYRNTGTSGFQNVPSGYVPYYLRPNGEGAVFYNTLPVPWNVLPEHVATPLTQIPSMQKAGFFLDFTGEVGAYRSFRGSFITGCHMLDIPITTKYMVLKYCLDRSKVLVDLLNTTEPSALGYRTVVTTLEERFGHSGILLNHHLQKLTDLPRIRETSLEEVHGLLDTTRGYEMARQASGAGNSKDPTYYNLVKGKLSDRLRREFARHCRDNGISVTDCNVNELIAWIKIHLAEPLALEPPTRVRQEKQDNPNKKSKPYNRHLSQTAVGSGAQPGPLGLEKKYSLYTGNGGGGCHLCKGPHPLTECPEFLAHPIPKRFDIIRELNSCFRCLLPSHIAASCPHKALCTKCKGEHHVLLHYKRKPNAHSAPNKSVRFAAPMTRSAPNNESMFSHDSTDHYSSENFNHHPNSTDHMSNNQEFLNHARMQTENKDYQGYLFALQGSTPVSLFFQWVLVTNPRTGQKDGTI